MASIFEKKAKVQAIIIFGLPVAAFFALLLFRLTKNADATSPFFWLGIAGMIGGYAMLVRAKWDQVKRGDFFTWGTTASEPSLKTLYVLSYCFMVVGVIVAGISGNL